MSIDFLQTLDLEGILDDLNTEVFSEELWNTSNYYKIAEVTYSYSKPGEIDHIAGVNYNNNAPEVARGPQLNKTLFCDIGELEFQDFKNTDEDGRVELIDESIQTIIENINQKKQKIDSYIQKIEEVDGDEAGEARKRIILGGLGEIQLQLDACIAGLPFEREKALVGIHFFVDGNNKHIISDEHRERLLKEVNRCNTEIYGEKLSSNSDYIEGCIDYLHTAYKEYAEKKNTDNFPENRKLSDEEQQRYEGYLMKLQNLSQNHTAKIIEKPERYIREDYAEIQVNKGDIVAGFNHHNNATGLEEKARFDDEVKGVTDTPNGILYPADSPKFQALTKERVDTLHGHEIGQHGFSEVRHKEVIGNIRGAKNLGLAEGAAKLSDLYYVYGPNLLKTITKDGKTYQIFDISKLGLIQNFPKTIMEEILSDEEFYDFLELQNKVEPDKMETLARYLRHKRTGFQRKDVTYTTGMIKAAKYVNELILEEREGDISDLWAGKVGFEQIEDFRIAEKAANDNNPGLKLPENMFFQEAEYFGIMQRKNRKIYRESDDFQVLKKYYTENKNAGKRKERRLNHNELMMGYKKALKKHAVSEENFYGYLQEKFPFLDFSKEKIDSVRFGFKAQLLGAIKLSEESIKIEQEIRSRQVPMEDKFEFREDIMSKSDARRTSEKILNRGEREMREAA